MEFDSQWQKTGNACDRTTKQVADRIFQNEIKVCLILAVYWRVTCPTKYRLANNFEVNGMGSIFSPAVREMERNKEKSIRRNASMELYKKQTRYFDCSPEWSASKNGVRPDATRKICIYLWNFRYILFLNNNCAIALGVGHIFLLKLHTFSVSNVKYDLRAFFIDLSVVGPKNLVVIEIDY